MPKRANANLLVAISLKFIVFTYNDAYWEYIFDRYLADLWSILECLIVLHVGGSLTYVQCLGLSYLL